MSILSTFKKYKDYILTENGYQLSSRWTKSDAVVMGDGTDDTNTLESNLGAIKGITSDLACEDTNVAASMSAVGAAITELNTNLTMRYNPDTDMVQIFYNGEWNDWKSGNMQTFYLYKDGEINTELDLSGYTWSTYSKTAPTKNLSNICVSLPSRTSGTTCSIFGTDDLIDLTKYKILGIEYSYKDTVYTLEVSVEAVTSGYVFCALVSKNTSSLSMYIGVDVDGKAITATSDIISSDDYSYSGTAVSMYVTKMYLK